MPKPPSLKIWKLVRNLKSNICKAWDPGWVRFDTKYVENNYLTQTYDFISLTECQVNICSWQDFWGIFIFSNSWANASHSFETWTPRRHEKCTVKHIRKPYVSYRIKTCKIRPWLLATATRILCYSLSAPQSHEFHPSNVLWSCTEANTNNNNTKFTNQKSLKWKSESVTHG